MKQFITLLQHDKPCFYCLKEISPKITNSKIKEGIFVDPKIRQFIVDEDLNKT